MFLKCRKVLSWLKFVHHSSSKLFPLAVMQCCWCHCYCWKAFCNSFTWIISSTGGSCWICLTCQNGITPAVPSSSVRSHTKSQIWQVEQVQMDGHTVVARNTYYVSPVRVYFCCVVYSWPCATFQSVFAECRISHLKILQAIDSLAVRWIYSEQPLRCQRQWGAGYCCHWGSGM